MLNLKTSAKNVEINFECGAGFGDFFKTKRGIDVKKCDVTISILNDSENTQVKLLEEFVNNMVTDRRVTVNRIRVRSCFMNVGQWLDNKSFSHSGLMNKHICRDCFKRTAVRKRLKRHKKYKESSGQFICLFCKKILPLKTHLASHIQSHRGVVGYKCGLHYNIRPNHMLFKHMRSHSRSVFWAAEFKCKKCGSTFDNDDGLEIHVKHCNGANGCDVCGKSFQNKKNLKSHRMMHFIHRPYNCSNSDSAFVTMASRKLNISEHSNTYKLTSFVQNYSNTKSSDTNTMGRTYSCNVCQSCYKTEEELKQHQKGHNLSNLPVVVLSEYEDQKLKDADEYRTEDRIIYKNEKFI